MPAILLRPKFTLTLVSALTVGMVLVITLLMSLVTFLDVGRERAISREELEESRSSTFR